MQKEQALQIIKAVLDEAVKKGLLINLEQCNQVLQAYTVILNLSKNDIASPIG